ncbi:uroporphyrinogen-III synthase [Aestuariirhabdus litorea]|uniref:uroporphyrinogen-III synthase n=1 Tax=Aestuariirhabdus litorea TaxID=2528527 RepID=UPI0013E32F91|nr:uroporphyrinogen-III synthase [Aestuariirhabdus litorea]
MPSSITTEMAALQGLRVLVTRPAEQAERLGKRLCAAGARTLLRPLIEPRALAESDAVRGTILDLDRFQKLIFISRPAARFGGELIDRYWPQLPMAIDWFAIGGGTAEELARFGVDAGFAQAGTDSEALLSLPEFANLWGQRILLVKGVGGREHLAEQMSARGAEVIELPVYERYPIDYDPQVFSHELAAQGINLAIATSGGIAERLLELVDRERRASIHLLVPSLRVAQLMADRGFASVSVSDGAGDSAIMESVQHLALQVKAGQS